MQSLLKDLFLAAQRDHATRQDLEALPEPTPRELDGYADYILTREAPRDGGQAVMSVAYLDAVKGTRSDSRNTYQEYRS